MSRFRLFVLLLLLATTAHAQEDSDTQHVVVSATRIETPIEKVGSSVTVIDAAQIKAEQQTVLTQMLRGVPGVDVRRTGGPGAQTSVFIRGTNSNHTKFRLDGIDLADPSTPGAIPQIELLMTNGVDRIEVLRGPQSALYGSDAIGGVVDITTKRGDGPMSFSISQENGSFNTSVTRLRSSGGSDSFDYVLNFTHLESDVFSSKSSNSEDDPYRANALSTRFGVTHSDTFETNIFIHYIEAENELDGFGATTNSDQTDSDRVFINVQPRILLMDGRWVATFNFKFAYQQRDIFVDAANKTFTGRAFEIDWQNDIELNDQHQLTTGLQYRREKGTASSTSIFDSPFADHRDIFSFYIQDQIQLGDRVSIIPGVRVDRFDDFGTEVTFRVAGVYRHQETGTTLRASVGTGFNAPSMDALGGFGANPDLEPEESIGFDIGVEQMLCNDRVRASATYFYNDIDNLISVIDTGGFVFMNVNIEKAVTQGVEFSLEVRPADNVRTVLAYTYTDTESGEIVAFSSLSSTQGGRLLRRPLHNLSIDVILEVLDGRGELAVGMQYVGERDDAGGTTGEAYTVVNLAGSFQLTDNVRIFGRVENMFDEKYEDVVGFKSARASAYGGVELTF